MNCRVDIYDVYWKGRSSGSTALSKKGLEYNRVKSARKRGVAMQVRRRNVRQGVGVERELAGVDILVPTVLLVSQSIVGSAWLVV
jgi:hypothetical protein